MKMVNLTMEQWIRYGIEQGYCSEPFCSTHEGPPMTPSEEEIWEKGGDPCCATLRLGNEDVWEDEAKSYLEIV